MNVVILAAGQGKRMNSDLPKVLQPLAGKPLLAHVIAVARALKPTMICVVYGHGGETGARTPGCTGPGLGATGKTARYRPCGSPGDSYLDPTKPTLVLYGDVPLTRIETLTRLIEQARAEPSCALALLTAQLVDPRGYGRIVRGSSAAENLADALQGAIQRIVEEKRRQRRGAGYPRNQYRHPLCPDRTPRALAAVARQPQCPGRILSDRHYCAGRGRGHARLLGATRRRLGNRRR